MISSRKRLPKVEEILKGTEQQPVKLKLEDAGDYFENEEEKKMVLKSI